MLSLSLALSRHLLRTLGEDIQHPFCLPWISSKFCLLTLNKFQPFDASVLLRGHCAQRRVVNGCPSSPPLHLTSYLTYTATSLGRTGKFSIPSPPFLDRPSLFCASPRLSHPPPDPPTPSLPFPKISLLRHVFFLSLHLHYDERLRLHQPSASNSWNYCPVIFRWRWPMPCLFCFCGECTIWVRRLKAAPTTRQWRHSIHTFNAVSEAVPVGTRRRRLSVVGESVFLNWTLFIVFSHHGRDTRRRLSEIESFAMLDDDSVWSPQLEPPKKVNTVRHRCVVDELSGEVTENDRRMVFHRMSLYLPPSEEEMMHQSLVTVAPFKRDPSESIGLSPSSRLWSTNFFGNKMQSHPSKGYAVLLGYPFLFFEIATSSSSEMSSFVSALTRNEFARKSYTRVTQQN